MAWGYLKRAREAMTRLRGRDSASGSRLLKRGLVSGRRRVKKSITCPPINAMRMTRRRASLPKLRERVEVCRKTVAGINADLRMTFHFVASLSSSHNTIRLLCTPESVVVFSQAVVHNTLSSVRPGSSLVTLLIYIHVVITWIKLYTSIRVFDPWSHLFGAIREPIQTSP